MAATFSRRAISRTRNWRALALWPDLPAASSEAVSLPMSAGCSACPKQHAVQILSAWWRHKLHCPGCPEGFQMTGKQKPARLAARLPALSNVFHGKPLPHVRSAVLLPLHAGSEVPPSALLKAWADCQSAKKGGKGLWCPWKLRLTATGV